MSDAVAVWIDTGKAMICRKKQSDVLLVRTLI